MTPKQSFCLDEALPGAVVRQWFRCGKPTCRCRRGPRHGPYFVRQWIENGRVRRAYVRPEDVEKTKERCKRWRQTRRDQRNGRKEVQASLREVRTLLRRLHELGMAI